MCHAERLHDYTVASTGQRVAAPPPCLIQVLTGRADIFCMTQIRPLRTAGATLAAIAALVVSWFAIQDLWHYWQAVSAGYGAWATSRQGVWQLTCGVAEATALVALLILAARLLGAKFVRTLGAQEAP